MSKSSEEGAAENSAPQDGSGEAGAQKDANASIYENRAGTKKIVRVVTVTAYVFSVSFTAILLSAYYVFIWEPPNPRLIQRSHLISDPSPDYLADAPLNVMSNGSLNLSVIPDIKSSDEHFDNLRAIATRRDSETLTNNPQKLIAPTLTFLKLYESATSSTPSDDPRSATRSSSTGVPFLHIRETESTTAKNESNVKRDAPGSTASVSIYPTIFLYATSPVTAIAENATMEKEARETPKTVLANVDKFVENDIDHGTDLYSPDTTSSVNEMMKFDEFSGSFKTSVKRNEKKDEARHFRDRTNGTVDSESKEEDIQGSEPLPAILTSGKTASTTPADLGAIIYRRSWLKFGVASFPEAIVGKVDDKDTTGNPETTTEEEPTPKESVAQELRKQNETELVETNPKEGSVYEGETRDDEKRITVKK